MSEAAIDRIVVEAGPGEVRAVAFAGEEAWDIAQERPFSGPGPGDIYRVRAGGEAPEGGRFFDMGGGVSGLARRARGDWTEGAYGLAQVLRAAAGDKGPRVTDRVWLADGGIEVALNGSGEVAERIEIARRTPKAEREAARAALEPALPDGAAVRIALMVGGDVVGRTLAAVARLRALKERTGGPGRVYAASGEVGWLVERWPAAAWTPADLATAAWLAGLERRPRTVKSANADAAREIDDVVADSLMAGVELAQGARLWIEPTRALAAIDVDRGGSPASGSEINRAAGREIARQLRLRRLGGLIAVDFLRDGLSAGLEALAACCAADPWPWTAPGAADPSGLVSFQRARMGPSLAEIATGIEGCALAGLRAAVRAANAGERPARLRAPAGVIHLLQTNLRPAFAETEARLGGPLDLDRAQGLGSIQIIGSDAQVLDEI